MSRMGVDCNDSRVKHDKHLRKVAEKRDILYRKELLLSVWEWQEEQGEDCHAYVLALRARVRALRNQYQNMRPVTDDEIS